MDPPEKPAPPAADLQPLTDDEEAVPVPTGEPTETTAAGAPDDDDDPPKRTWRDWPSQVCKHPGCPKRSQGATKFCISHGGGGLDYQMAKQLRRDAQLKNRWA